MTEPNPTPAQKARSLRETYDRWSSGLDTVEITRGPRPPLLPIEPAFEEEEDDE